MFRGTTIVAVRKDGQTAIAGDGQVTLGEHTAIKHNARKVRRVYHGRVVVGFAGSVADALTLAEKFEEKLQKSSGNLPKAAVELVKEWRTDRVLRRLEAMLVVADKESILLIAGSGEVIEPQDGIVAIGSGSTYALAAARALARHSNLSASDIAVEALKIAAEICVYTNANIVCETV